MKSMLISLAATFAMRQVQKFADKIDIAKVKFDLEPRVRALIPGEFFDGEAVALANRAVEIGVEFIKGDTDDRVAKLLVEGKTKEALDLTIEYVKGKLGI